jgi:hypothetical protein
MEMMMLPRDMVDMVARGRMRRIWMRMRGYWPVRRGRS